MSEHDLLTDEEDAVLAPAESDNFLVETFDETSNHAESDATASADNVNLYLDARSASRRHYAGARSHPLEGTASLVQEMKKILHTNRFDIDEFIRYGYSYCARIDDQGLARLHTQVQQAQNSVMPLDSGELLTALGEYVRLAKALPMDELLLAELVGHKPRRPEREKFDLVNSLVPFFGTLLQTLQQASELEKKDWTGELEAIRARETDALIKAVMSDTQCGSQVDRSVCEAQLNAKLLEDSLEQMKFKLLMMALSRKTNLERQGAISRLQHSAEEVLTYARKIRNYVKQQVEPRLSASPEDDLKHGYHGVNAFFANADTALLAAAIDDRQAKPPVFQDTASIEAAVQQLQEDDDTATSQFVGNLFTVFRCLQPVYYYLRWMAAQLASQVEVDALYRLRPELSGIETLCKEVKSLAENPLESPVTQKAKQLGRTIADMSKATTSYTSERLNALGNTCKKVYKAGVRKVLDSDVREYSPGFTRAVEQAALMFSDKIQLVKHRIRSLPEHIALLELTAEQWGDIDERCEDMRTVTAGREPRLFQRAIDQRLAAERESVAAERQQSMVALAQWLAPVTELAPPSQVLMQELKALFNEYKRASLGEMTAKEKAFCQKLYWKAEQLAKIAGEVQRVAEQSGIQMDKERRQQHRRQRQSDLAHLLNELKVFKAKLKKRIAGVTEHHLLSSFPNDERLARGVGEMYEGLKQAYLAEQPEGERMAASERFNTTLQQVLRDELFSEPSGDATRHFFIRLMLVLRNSDAGVVYFPRSRESILAGICTIEQTIKSTPERRMASSLVSLAAGSTLKCIITPLSFIARATWRICEYAYREKKQIKHFERSVGYGQISSREEKKEGNQRLMGKILFSVVTGSLPVPALLVSTTYTCWRLYDDKHYAVTDLATNVSGQLPMLLMMRCVFSVGGRLFNVALCETVQAIGKLLVGPNVRLEALKKTFLVSVPEGQRAEAEAWFDRLMERCAKEGEKALTDELRAGARPEAKEWASLLQQAMVKQALHEEIKRIVSEFRQDESEPTLQASTSVDEAVPSTSKFRVKRAASAIVPSEMGAVYNKDMLPRRYFDDIEKYAPALELDELIKLIPGDDSVKQEFDALCKGTVTELAGSTGGGKQYIHPLTFLAKLREKLTYREKMLGASPQHSWYGRAIKQLDKNIQSYATKYPQSVAEHTKKIDALEKFIDEAGKVIRFPPTVDPDEILTIGKGHPKYDELCRRDWKKKLDSSSMPREMKAALQYDNKFRVRLNIKGNRKHPFTEKRYLWEIYQNNYSNRDDIEFVDAYVDKKFPFDFKRFKFNPRAPKTFSVKRSEIYSPTEIDEQSRALQQQLASSAQDDAFLAVLRKNPTVADRYYRLFGYDQDMLPRHYFDDIEQYAPALELDELSKLIPDDARAKEELHSLCKETTTELAGSTAGGGQRIHPLAFLARLREKLTYRAKIVGISPYNSWYGRAIKQLDKNIQSYAAKCPLLVAEYTKKIGALEKYIDEAGKVIKFPPTVDPDETLTIGKGHPKYDAQCRQKWEKLLDEKSEAGGRKALLQYDRKYTVKLRDSDGKEFFEKRTIGEIYRNDYSGHDNVELVFIYNDGQFQHVDHEFNIIERAPETFSVKRAEIYSQEEMDEQSTALRQQLASSTHGPAGRDSQEAHAPTLTSWQGYSLNAQELIAHAMETTLDGKTDMDIKTFKQQMVQELLQIFSKKNQDVALGLELLRAIHTISNGSDVDIMQDDAFLAALRGNPLVADNYDRLLNERVKNPAAYDDMLITSQGGQGVRATTAAALRDERQRLDKQEAELRAEINGMESAARTEENRNKLGKANERIGEVYAQKYTLTQKERAFAAEEKKLKPLEKSYAAGIALTDSYVLHLPLTFDEYNRLYFRLLQEEYRALKGSDEAGKEMLTEKYRAAKLRLSGIYGSGQLLSETVNQMKKDASADASLAQATQLKQGDYRDISYAQERASKLYAKNPAAYDAIMTTGSTGTEIADGQTLMAAIEFYRLSKGASWKEIEATGMDKVLTYYVECKRRDFPFKHSDKRPDGYFSFGDFKKSDACSSQPEFTQQFVVYKENYMAYDVDMQVKLTIVSKQIPLHLLLTPPKVIYEYKLLDDDVARRDAKSGKLTAMQLVDDSWLVLIRINGRMEAVHVAKDEIGDSAFLPFFEPKKHFGSSALDFVPGPSEGLYYDPPKVDNTYPPDALPSKEAGKYGSTFNNLGFKLLSNPLFSSEDTVPIRGSKQTPLDYTTEFTKETYEQNVAASKAHLDVHSTAHKIATFIIPLYGVIYKKVTDSDYQMTEEEAVFVVFDCFAILAALMSIGIAAAQLGAGVFGSMAREYAGHLAAGMSREAAIARVLRRFPQLAAKGNYLFD